MTNELVSQEEFILFQNGVGGENIISFFNGIKQEICASINCKMEEIEFDMKEDENFDPEAISQRYLISVKKGPEAAQKFIETNGPYSLYVRM